MILRVAHTWDGHALPAHEVATVSATLTAHRLLVEVDAPFAADPPPPHPPGPTPRLWEHEVVELFLAGDGEAYTELELGPRGHHLLLRLEGVRRIVAEQLPVRFEAEVRGARWRGRAEVDARALPAPIRRVNAYRIAGVGSARRYLAHAPVPGEAPDFHRLAHFAPWLEASRP